MVKKAELVSEAHEPKEKEYLWKEEKETDPGSHANYREKAGLYAWH